MSIHPSHAASPCLPCTTRHLFTTLAIAQDSSLAQSVQEWRIARRHQHEMMAIFRRLGPKEQKKIRDTLSAISADPEMKRIRNIAGRTRDPSQKRTWIEKAYLRFADLLPSHPIVAALLGDSRIRRYWPRCAHVSSG
jgi:hypothetical protein